MGQPMTALLEDRSEAPEVPDEEAVEEPGSVVLCGW
jgi:hypothetical protein